MIMVILPYVGYIKKFYEKSNVGPFVFALILLLASPILIIFFNVTVILDLCVGEIIDLSYASMANTIIHVVVIFTAVSIGLRSGNPINAIQTFAGFDFIDQLDELVIESIEIDAETLAETKDIGISNKILTIRLTIYIFTPMVVIGIAYLTIINECYIFCSNGTDDTI